MGVWIARYFCGMSPKLKLRRFLYLDGVLTDEFLAQAEGGLYDEEAQSSTERSELGIGGGVGGGPIKAGGSSGKADEEARARLVRQTQESAFSRLAGMLEENDSVQWLETLDRGIWDQLERGEVLEVECHLEVPLLVKFMLVAFQMEAVEGVMKATGQKFDAETRQGIKALMAIGGLFQSVPVIGTVAGSEEFKFLAQINPEHLRVGADELDGTARLYCTLDRKLASGEQHSIVDSIPAMRNMPNREEFEASLGEIEEFTGKPVTDPAAVVTAVAIFR